MPISVLVTDSGHGAAQGSFVTFDSFPAVDGLDMNNEFEVTFVVNTAAYVVTHTGTASGSTASGGGSGNMKYQINQGPEFSVPAFGWGTRCLERINVVSCWRTTSNVTLQARQWSLDNFGEDLIATALDGGILHGTRLQVYQLDVWQLQIVQPQD